MKRMPCIFCWLVLGLLLSPAFSQEPSTSNESISTDEFIAKREANPFDNQVHWLELVYFKHATDDQIQTLINSDNEWLAITAKWWSTRKKIERKKNVLTLEQRKLTMERFLGYFEGRTRLVMPRRMQHLLRKSVAEKRGQVWFQPSGKLIGEKVSHFDKTKRRFFRAKTDTSAGPSSIWCDNTKTKERIWETKFVGLNENISFSMPPSVIWAQIAYDEINNVIYYWGVNSDGAFVLKFNADSGQQLGAARFSCATAG